MAELASVANPTFHCGSGPYSAIENEHIMADAPSPELMAAANIGDAEAQNEVGKFYAGLGSASGDEIAEFWFARAADQGLPKAMHNPGVLAQRGRRSASARTWFTAAAERGWRNSSVALGVLLEEDGREEEAVRLYEAAAFALEARLRQATHSLRVDILFVAAGTTP
jgi:hypothetical protein